MKRTVIFGGTFNPPHLAHMEILDLVLSRDDTEKVIMIPTSVPPHKICRELADDKDRLAMCTIAAAGKKKVFVSDIEIERGGKSYTYDTLCYLKKNNPEMSFAIVCGGDMIVSFKQWYRFEDILKTAAIIAVRRTGTDNSEFDASVKSLKENGADIEVIEASVTGISSTQIRENINNPEYLLKYLPKGVYDYIKKNGLYGD